MWCGVNYGLDHLTLPSQFLMTFGLYSEASRSQTGNKHVVNPENGHRAPSLTESVFGLALYARQMHSVAGERGLI